MSVVRDSADIAGQMDFLFISGSGVASFALGVSSTPLDALST